MNLSCPRDELSWKYQMLSVCRSQQNHNNHNCSVLFCCKRSNCIYCVIMMAICTEMVLFFPNIYFFLKVVVGQSPTSRLSVSDQSAISRQQVTDQMKKDRRTWGDWSTTDWRLVGDHTSNRKLVVMDAVENKISRREIAARSQALWHRENV